ncbi:MAG: diaminopimelate decarboxylase [Clostridia bacterium]|nr:diaminopimelate decarboxylase [Clostridia bacterium]MBQ6937022.1 diaminopimelate decarboxylase [Clostridia bacterium]
MLHTNLDINEKGNLTFAGYDTVELAKEYKTPLYLLDEERIREKCRTYLGAMKKHFGEGSTALYASKALSLKEIYRIAKEEGMSVDVVSGGEIYTAKTAGFPMENVYFHGNNKTDDEIEYAIECGIGYFVADCREELIAINSFAQKKNIVQKIILRLTPGIDTHTYEAVRTGQVDSKFGTAIETGQAIEITEFALSLSNISLEGFHCHVGSQVFDGQTFCDSADIMLDYIAFVKEKLGYEAKILNLGGGYGVRYVESDPHLDIEKSIGEVSVHIKKKCSESGIDMPKILMEPGRSIVADAGLTLYSVGSVKTITGYKSYVAIDGGMTDNPRYALYKSAYSSIIANKAKEEADFCCAIAGKCCESGDLIAEDIMLQKPERGDILAVMVTGAYNYSMSSNYNRIPRPPVVMLSKEGSRVVVKRESYEDVAKNDI